MKNSLTKRSLLILIVCTFVGCFALLSGIVLNSVNHYINALLIILSAIVLYFGIVLGPANRNWLDVRAVFSLMWFGTIGLATLRLVDYQETWQNMTWVVLALAYGGLMIGSTLGMIYGPRLYRKIQSAFGKIKFRHLQFHMKENRLFTICVVTTVIGLICFIINVAIKGYIPCFSDSTTAYLDFYTKFHIFSTAATGVSGLCFYCIRKQPLKLWKKIVLGLCIFYLVFAFPVMVVSRGIFMVAALSLIASIFYTCGKRFWALVLSIVLVMGVYLFTSTLRNYTDQQLSSIFQPSQITRPSDPDSDSDTDSPFTSFQPVSDFPRKFAFLYGYVTVSHDNLNEAVQNRQSYTWGLRQLPPINVVLQSDWIAQANTDAEYYTVTPNLLTTNLVGDFYYDFGAIGVLLFMLLWSFVFGAIQGIHEMTQGPFSLLALGNTMTPVALCFFDSWMSIFSFWLFWGVTFLFAVAACTTRIPKNQ